MEVLFAEYRGFLPGFPGRIAYVVNGRDIYFTGLTSPSEATSTINAAEAVVTAICRMGEVHWSRGRFFDVQTHRGYPRHPVGSYEVDQLVITGEQSPSVERWIPVADIPQAVLDALRKCIEQ